MRIDIVTIFPEYFGSPLGVSLIGKAAVRGDIEFGVHDLRRWATDVHHTVDDLPFGGGPGMVMKPDVWGDALDEIVPADGGSARLVVPTPSGVPFTQDIAARYAAEPRLVFACGRYEGIDGRVVEAMRARMPVDEVSVGDYVLAGVPKRLEQRIASLKLTVTPQGTIQGMTIEETDGVANSFTFSGEVDNPPAPNAAFVFAPPQGVHIVTGMPPV